LPRSYVHKSTDRTAVQWWFFKTRSGPSGESAISYYYTDATMMPDRKAPD